MSMPVIPLGLDVTVQLQRPPDQTPDNSEDLKRELDRKAAALTHVRTLHIWWADLRARNFNYFILLTGALIAAMAQEPAPGLLRGVVLAGVLISAVFFLLDLRVWELIGDSRAEMLRLEDYFELHLFQREWTTAAPGEAPAQHRKSMITNTVLYRSVTGGMALVWLLLLALSVGWLK